MDRPTREFSDNSSSDDDSLDQDLAQPVITKLFQDAALYDEALTEAGLYSNEKGAGSVAGFADLIAGDLNTPEKAITGRFAKLAVTGDTWTSGDLTSEPGSYDSDSDSEESFAPSEPPVQESPVIVPALPRSATVDGEKWKLDPEEIINLLTEEFGSLSEDGKEEKLIVEADGALFNDVLILVRPLPYLALTLTHPPAGCNAPNNPPPCVPRLSPGHTPRPLPAPAGHQGWRSHHPPQGLAQKTQSLDGNIT